MNEEQQDRIAEPDEQRIGNRLARAVFSQAFGDDNQLDASIQQIIGAGFVAGVQLVGKTEGAVAQGGPQQAAVVPGGVGGEENGPGGTNYKVVAGIHAGRFKYPDGSLFYRVAAVNGIVEGEQDKFAGDIPQYIDFAAPDAVAVGVGAGKGDSFGIGDGQFNAEGILAVPFVGGAFFANDGVGTRGAHTYRVDDITLLGGQGDGRQQKEKYVHQLFHDN